MKKIILLYLVFCFASISAQRAEWLAVNQSQLFQGAMKLASDADGNTYAFGTFQNTMFTTTDTISAFSGADLFLQKINAAGQVQWLKHIDISANTSSQDFCIDADKNMYASVSINGSDYWDEDTAFTMQTGPGAVILSFDSTGKFRWYKIGVSNNPALASSASLSGFFMASGNSIQKRDAAGNVIWSKSTTGQATIEFTGLNYNDDNRLAAVGYFVGSGLIPKTLGLDTVTVNFTNFFLNNGLFLMDTTGGVIWGRSIFDNLSTSSNLIREMAVGSTGEVYAYLGGVSDPFLFASDTLFNANSITSRYAGVLKFSNTGAAQWARAIYSSGNCYVNDLVIADNDGVVFGATTDGPNMVFGPFILPSGGTNGVLAKLSSSGQYLWAKSEPRNASFIAEGVSSICKGLNNTYTLGGGFALQGFQYTYYYGCKNAAINPTYNTGPYFANVSDHPEGFANTDFTFISEGLTTYFTNTLANPLSSNWNYGDGNNSSQFNPSHAYAGPGSYNVCLSSDNNCGTGTTCKNVVLDGLQNVTPSAVASYGSHFLFIRGGFSSNPTDIRFVKPGSADLVPVFFTRVNTGLVQANLDLDSVDVGNYSLIYQSPSLIDTLDNALNVELADTILPDVFISGPLGVRTPRATLVKINVRNRSNNTYYGIPLYITTNPQLVPDLLVSEHSDSVVKDLLLQLGSRFVKVEDRGPGDSMLVSAILIPNMAPGQSMTFNLYVRNYTNQINTVRALTGRSYFSSANLLDMGVRGRSSCNFLPPCGQCLLDLADLVPGVGCVSGSFNLGCSIGAGFGGRPQGGASDIIVNAVSTAISCAGASGILHGVTSKIGHAAVVAAELGHAGHDLHDLDHSCNPKGGGCGPGNENNFEWPSASGMDPNYLGGPKGKTSENYFNKYGELGYIVHFENVDSATATAAEVFVTDTLNKNVFDLRTFSFTGFGFADSVIDLQETSHQSFSRELDLRPAKNTILRVRGTIDTSTGIIHCSFQSLDPTTYDVISTLNDGFLNPNVTSPEGEGFLSFNISLKNSVNHLQTISNAAHIVFDENPSIATNTHINTIDTVKPVSNMLAVAYGPGDSLFTLRWTGSDSHAGVSSWDVYVSINDSVYRKFISLIPDDSVIAKGTVGNKYEFYTRAHDYAGNIEAAPSDPDNFPDVSVVLITGLPETKDNLKLNVFPNPTNSQLTIITQEHASDSKLTLMDVLGREISFGVINRTGSSITIQTSHLANGFYSLMLKSGNKTGTAKFVKQ